MKRAALLLLVACSSPPREPAPPDPVPVPDSVSPAPSPLQLVPRTDLLANLIRWHTYDRGLVVSFIDDSFRKYDLDYKSAWGDVREVDGRAGRAFRGKATLTVPTDGVTRIVVRARGKGTLSVSGHRTKLAGTWQELTFDAAAASGRVTVDAPKGTLIHSIELIAADADAGCGADWPTPAGDHVGDAARQSIYVEIPADAYLVATPTGTGHARATVTAVDGTHETLLDADAPGTAQRWPLAAFAGQLVRLDLEGCGVRWDAPAIALPARPDPPPFTPVRNVVLVVVDTLRADRLALYADTPVQTPRLTAAARERGVVFLRNQSMAPSSPPSHATIHTGQIPRVHGANGDEGAVSSDSPVLATLLHDAGFYTAYVGNNDFAMDKLKKVAEWDHRATPYYARHDKDCGAIVDGALEQLGHAREVGQRAFVSLLPIEPHVPYRYHDGVTDRYHPGEWEGPFGKHATARTLVKIRKMDLTAGQWSQVHALYAGEVEHADGCIGALLDGIDQLGATDDTAIVVTSDHGEGMGERGGHATGHAYGLHGELISVPLIVIGGGLGPATVDVVTSNADIAPTILDLLGLAVDERMQGQSLLPVARAGAPWPQRVVASEYGRSYALRGGRWRMVVGYDGDATLHDVVADPEEGRDVSADQPMVRRWLSDAAGLYLAYRTRWHDATWGSLTDIAPTSPLAPATMRP